MENRATFSKPPQGFSFATKYQNNTDSIGIFPNEFKNFDVNTLPLEHDRTPHVNRYYFAWKFEPRKWNLDYFAVSDGHGSMVKTGSKSDIKKHLLCIAHADQALDNNLDKNIPFQEAVNKSREAMTLCEKTLFAKK